MKIAVVTDSVANLDQTYVSENLIKVIPSTVIFKGQQYLDDGKSLDVSEMLREMRGGSVMTSDMPATEEDYRKAYYELLNHADHIISLHSSRNIVPEYYIAGRAAQQFGNLITVLDSRSTSVAVGLQAMRLVEGAKQGKSIETLVAEQKRSADNSKLYFIIDDLKYLYYRKLINAATAVVGNLVHLKPFMVAGQDEIGAGGRAFGQRRALEAMANIAKRYHREHGGRVRFGFGSTPGGEDGAYELRQLVQHLSFEDVGEWEIGLTAAASAGPGVVGMVMDLT